MRRNALMFTAILGSLGLSAPGSAMAADLDGWDYTPLLDDWKLSAVMEGDVISSDGKDVGDVHDIIFNEAGLLDSIVVEQHEKNLNWNFYEVAWSDIDFDPASGEVMLELDKAEVEALPDLELAEFSGPEEIEASNLIGMPVNLDGVTPYGEVTNVTVTPGANELSALIVESDGLGAFSYAVPADISDIDADSVGIVLPYTVEEVEDLDWVVF